MSQPNPAFPFQFKLDPTDVQVEDSQRLQEFVRQQIEGLLDIVVLTSAGKPVDVDGFVWMKDAYRSSNDAPAAVMPVDAPVTHRASPQQ